MTNTTSLELQRKADALDICLEALPTWSLLGADTKTDIFNLVMRLAPSPAGGGGIMAAREPSLATGMSCEEGQEIETVECAACLGNGFIDEPARTEGHNQHSACRWTCEECGGSGRVPA